MRGEGKRELKPISQRLNPLFGDLPRGPGPDLEPSPEHKQKIMLKRAAEACERLVVTTDYGWLYIHPERGHAFWTMGDAETGSGPHEIEEALSSVEGINFIDVLPEMVPSVPPGADQDDFDEDTGGFGWVRIDHGARHIDSEDFDYDEETYTRDMEDWHARGGSSRIENKYGSTWVRPGHEDEYREWLASEHPDVAL